MDLRLHLAVLWRFRLLIAGGFVLAALLAALSVARISFDGGKPHLAYRGEELWVSHETLLVSQTGFPIGQSVFNEVVPLRTASGSPVIGDQGKGDYVPRYADPGRFAELAVLYARLANSDPVERLLFAKGPIPGGVSISATGVSDQQAGPLPLIQVSGMGTSVQAAVEITHRAAYALRRYIAAQQVANRVPKESRVVLSTVKNAERQTLIEDGLAGTLLVQGHSKMRPMVVFIALMGLFIAIAFLLENLTPRLKPVDATVVHSRKSA